MRKKIIVIGATGTLGSAVASELEAADYEVVRASRKGSPRVELEDLSTLDALFAAVSAVDGVVCVAASVGLSPLESLSDTDVVLAMKGKLFGQVALLQRAAKHLRDGGSITLTGGTFKSYIPGSSLGALVNAGLEGFIRSVAREMPRGIRANLVSPGWIRETLLAMGQDGSEGTPASEVARAYLEAVTGKMQGQVLIP
ncbi:short chain dehydrogenase [Ktedonosporobacter rubrisoli]|uniref:Short chain dehydrogenase n=1 Tax=Ktedonosporobacter rubrisoli TaxID=2509675 RepID=A0A4P6JKS5_KTERU|nr:short chain dehydrogenase [Ktedonosporobacter rubrisoli]QBD75572.1 short chain dehydrogenase [Ktedonosporobacter rubrisoli]